MNLTPLMAAAISQLLPVGVEIDLGTWPAQVETVVRIDLVAMDGSQGRIPAATFYPAASPEQVRTFLSVALKDLGWKFRKGDRTTLIIEGTAKSPVKAVKWESFQWTPPIRPVPKAVKK